MGAASLKKYIFLFIKKYVEINSVHSLWNVLGNKQLNLKKYLNKIKNKRQAF